MSPSPNAEQRQVPAPADRVRIILDVAEVQMGRSVTFSEVSEYLRGRGVSISRARWSYMVNGHRTVDDHRLLDALSDFVGVDRAFLRGDNGVPEIVASRLDLVRALRAAKVRSYALRTLGDLCPETLGKITDVLDAEIRKGEG